MAGAIDDGDEWAEIRSQDWFASAQATADEQSFFHWELEYPEVFFGEDGEKRDDAGFDAVIGNPPWVRSINIKTGNKSSWKYYKQNFESASKGEYDLYICFIEQAQSILSDEGKFGHIVPNKWFTSQVGTIIRSRLTQNQNIRKVVDFGSEQLFEGITTYSCLLFLDNTANDEIDVWQFKDGSSVDQNSLHVDDAWNKGIVEPDDLGSDPWSFDIGPVGEIFEKLSNKPKLGDVSNIFQGIGTRADPIFLLKQQEGQLYSEELEESVEIEEEVLRPAIKGTDIDRYNFDSNRKLLFPYQVESNTSVINKENLQNRFPRTWDYLNKVKEQLESREGGKYRDSEQWYQYGRPQNMKRSGDSKVVIPDVVDEATAALDDTGHHIVDTIYGVESKVHDHRFLTAILNSNILTAFLNHSGTDLRGGYFRMKTAYLDPFPVPKIQPPEEIDHRPKEIENILKNHDEIEKSSDQESRYIELCSAVELRTNKTDKLAALNLNLLDHLGNYSEGQSLVEIGLVQPRSGAAESILQETTEKYPNLRVGTASVVRESSSTVEVQLTARYKPEELAEDVSGPVDDRETDQWGYVETDPETALRITDLTETEADLIEAFVPVAIDEAGGFAGFRETATKTNSLVDRLHKLTLPAVSDVETGLKSYMQTKKRAEELEAKIEQTDELIDEIVYELYGLTDEEIEIVEEAVST